MISFFASSLTGGLIVGTGALAQRKKEWLTDVMLATCFGVYPLMFGLTMVLTRHIRYTTYDSALYHIDRMIGLDPFVWISYVLSHPWMYRFLMSAYMALPIMLAISWLVEQSEVMIKAIGLAPLFALIIYLVVPGVGPIHAFNSEHMLLPFNTITEMPRNAFPSMHLTWALLIAFNAKHKQWLVVSIVFVVLTAMATICSGEHYCIDLIAAVPFSMSVQWLATKLNKEV